MLLQKGTPIFKKRYPDMLLKKGNPICCKKRYSDMLLQKGTPICYKKVLRYVVTKRYSDMLKKVLRYVVKKINPIC